MAETAPSAKEIDPELLARHVRAAQAGEEASIAWLIQASQNRLLGFCIYLAGESQLAQDLCQDTLVKVLENLGELKEPKSFLSWLFRMAKNLYLDFVKAHGNRGHEGLDELPEAVLAATHPQREDVVAIRQTLARLDPDDRLLLLVVDLEGYSYEEAAGIIGVSEDAVRSRLHRARKAFSEKYKKD